MIITYYGISCFKIQSGEVVLAIDPFSKETGLTPPRFQAHIALVSEQSPLHAHTETLSGSPFVIATPGEYELRGIVIEGIRADNHTLFILEWEGLRLCHLGALSDKNLPDATREQIGTPDILFLPIGGGGALDMEEAIAVMNQIEPRIVIPMYYAMPGFKALPLEKPDAFLKEVGSTAKPEEKVTIKKKDVPQEETMIKVLSPTASK